MGNSLNKLINEAGECFTKEERGRRICCLQTSFFNNRAMAGSICLIFAFIFLLIIGFLIYIEK